MADIYIDWNSFGVGLVVGSVNKDKIVLSVAFICGCIATFLMG